MAVTVAQTDRVIDGDEVPCARFDGWQEFLRFIILKGFLEEIAFRTFRAREDR